MSDDYTPTTEEVREALAEWAWSRRMFRPELGSSDGREPDRWLAAHDAEVRAAVLAEQGEPEWEYGVTGLDPTKVVMKRTPGREAGPWLPVEENGESE